MDTAADCLVCGKPLLGSNSRTNGDWIDYDCPRCGKYSLTGTVVAVRVRGDALSRRDAAKLSHAIRRAQVKGVRPKITWEMWDRILESTELPSPAQQGERLVSFVGDTLEAPGDFLNVDPGRMASEIGAVDDDGLLFVLRALVRRGELEFVDPGAETNVTLSYEGWLKYEGMKRGIAEGRRAFMAMPFGDAVLSEVVESYFKPAVHQAGFALMRLDDEPKAGSIDNRLRVEIRSARFLVADLSASNAGAYWEAGFAEGLGRPVIYTCSQDVWQKHKTHFDTEHMHTVVWSEGEPAVAARQLRDTIRATLPDEAQMPTKEEIELERCG